MAQATPNKTDTQAPIEKTTPQVVEVGEHGYGLGLAGFITSFFVGVVGIVLSAVALHQSKSIGKRNTFARAGLVIGIIRAALDVLGLAAIVVVAVLETSYCDAHPDTYRCSDGGYSHSQYYYDQSDGSDGSSSTPDQTY